MVFHAQLDHCRAEARLAKYGSETSIRRGSASTMNRPVGDAWRWGPSLSYPNIPRGDSGPTDRKRGSPLIGGAKRVGRPVAEELVMESFPVDIDAGQIVRWIMAEQAAAPATFKTSARRTTEVRRIAERREYHLGDEEREDLSEVATIGTLEIAPAHGADGWLLTVTVEDEVGPQELGVEAVPEAEHQIDIGTFYTTFIRPERGTASVVAEVDNPTAWPKVQRLLDAIERDRRDVTGPSSEF